jgi:hypothetical protein
MKVTTNIVALIALVSITAPAFARDHDHDGYRDGHRNGQYRNGRYQRSAKNYRKVVHNRNKAINQANRQAARWDWNKHNWNDQRAHMNTNWAARSAALDEAKRQQLDSQLRTQWMAYHNNNWNGTYNFNQYSDPGFLDYVHTRNPSMLTQIRNVIGF